MRCNHPEHTDTTAAECLACPHRETVRWPVRFDESNLAVGWPGKRFNSSIIPWQDGYALAWRSGWAGSEIIVSLLDADFRPTGTHSHLSLWHTEASYGREDPRLFIYQGRLHVMYIGVVVRGRRRRQVSHTSVLYARLAPDLAVEAIFYPAYRQRRAWEKNWGFFEHDGGVLHAVYSIAPHRILTINGNGAEFAYESNGWTNWNWGEPRGGAPPVRVGAEWYHWFHGRKQVNGKQRYATGVYTFAAEPPFRILRMTPTPILEADPASNKDNYADVVFTCGAVKRDGFWVISSGIHDRWTELHRFSVAEVEAKLQPV